MILPVFFSSWPARTPPENEAIVPAATALPHAHAHNDYRHDKPLREALSRGFTSVEADVHLVGNELYLGHWLPQISADRTLKGLYLAPLSSLMTRQQGKVYTNYEGIFYLMIDIKTDSLATYRVLWKQLQQYPVFRCNPHFQVFISGNRAMHHIQNDPEQMAAVDGRLPDLVKCAGSDVMPVISDNFRKFFKWRGKGPMPALESERLQAFVNEAHRQGKKLRFWSIPDQPNVWETLLKAGVDFINTDNLQGLERFMTTRMNATPRAAEPLGVLPEK
ncbi:MAG: hypothetical protein IPJ82_08710 [Lewinellaceae bacterium]|nr:hypothetical protein [Lewinellaceae bacterium]